MTSSNITKILAFLLIVSSCSPSKKEAQNQNEPDGQDIEKQEVLQASLERDPRKIGPAKPKSQYKIEENIYKINAAEHPLYGYWVGAFGKNKINIALAHIDEDSIHGHSVCAGNFRPIKGTIEQLEQNLYSINMVEPGDDKYDGEFNFVIDLKKGELSGRWKPYKNTVSAKEYTLTKRTFSYDVNVGDFPEASRTWLNVPDVENLLPEEIELIRNEIYARHGYSFTNLKIRRIFDAKDWYIPMAVDIRDQITELEAHNIDLLYNYEDYYDEYYNEYGR